MRGCLEQRDYFWVSDLRRQSHLKTQTSLFKNLKFVSAHYLREKSKKWVNTYKFRLPSIRPKDILLYFVDVAIIEDYSGLDPQDMAHQGVSQDTEFGTRGTRL